MNDILGFTGLAAIHDVEFLATILDPEIAAKKQSIVDVLCKDSQGSRYIIEMQFTKTKGFEKRAQYYAAKAYSNQADQGDEYHNLKEIIFIAVADCIIFSDKAEYKSNHTIRDENTNEHDLKDFYFVFIELPKFTKTKEDQLENIVEKWCYFFRYAAETREEDLDKVVGSDVIIKRAYEEMNKFNWSEEELLAYEQRKKRIMDEIAAFAEKFDEGLRLGQEKGRQEGILIGHQKLSQDNELFKSVKEAKNEKDKGKLDKLLKEIEGLLKSKTKSGFKPSLNYSPDGNDENTTIKIAIKASGKVLQLLYDYAEKNIGTDTEIFKKLKHAKENPQSKRDLCNVSVSSHSTFTQRPSFDERGFSAKV